MVSEIQMLNVLVLNYLCQFNYHHHIIRLNKHYYSISITTPHGGAELYKYSKSLSFQSLSDCMCYYFVNCVKSKHTQVAFTVFHYVQGPFTSCFMV